MSAKAHDIKPRKSPEAPESGLLALSGVGRRLGPPVEEAPKSAHPLRLGLQGRFAVAVLSIVLVVMIGVAVYELRSEIQTVTLVDGRTIDLTNLRTFNEWTQAILFLLRTPIIALVAVGFVILYYMSRHVVAPLKSAGEVADAIAGGDLTRQISYAANDEIGDLVKSFNIMTRSLVRKVDQLASLNQAGHAFSSHLSLEKLGETIAENVHGHVRPSITGLYTVDQDEIEEGASLAEALKRADGEGEFGDAVVEVQNALALRALESENLCLVQEGDPQVRCSDAWIAGRPVRAIGLPLFSEGHAFGALTLTVERTGESFSADDIEFLKTLASHVSVATKNAQLYRSLEISYLDTVAALAAAVDAKDAYTRGHSDRVMRNTVHLARAIGLSQREVSMIRYSALLHDVGKIGLPTHILSTKANLTKEEHNLVKQHPMIGYQIVRPISFLRPALDGILYHHERWDGQGYPEGLAAEDIPLMARLLALADTWDAMAHDRFYRRARSAEEIVEELRDCTGTQFDPTLVQTVVEILPSVTEEDRREYALKESDQ